MCSQTELRLQVKAGHTIHLKVDIKPTIAFTLFNVLQGVVCGLGFERQSDPYLQTAEIFFTAALVSSSHGYIANALSDNHQLQALMGVKALDRSLDSAAVGRVTAPDSQVPGSQMPWLLFVRLMGTECCIARELGAKADLTTISLPEKVIHAGVARRLQLLTDRACSKQDMINDYEEQLAGKTDDDQTPQQHIGHRLKLLRAAILLVKFVSLVGNVTGSSDGNHVLMAALTAIHSLTSAFVNHSSNHNSAEDNSIQDSHASQPGDADQEFQLSLYLSQLLILWLKQSAKDTEAMLSKASAPEMLCLLNHLLYGVPDRHCQALSAHIHSAGQSSAQSKQHSSSVGMCAPQSCFQFLVLWASALLNLALN